LGSLRTLELARCAVELPHDPLECGRGLFGGHLFTRLVPRRTRRVAHEPQRRLGETAGFMQLVNQEQHHVSFPDTPKPPRNLTQLM
jgi:hypothetical protein